MSRSKMPHRTYIAAWWKLPENECWLCGYNNTKDLERCHIVARCDGGDDSVQNLQILCSLCHEHTEFWSKDEKIEVVESRRQEP